MNNPDWQHYEKAIVKMQLEAGHDGIFFDNPTVHPQGCYCEFCMRKFQTIWRPAGVKVERPPIRLMPTYMRKIASSASRTFYIFVPRSPVIFSRKFKIRAQVKPKAMITCNNSLNSPTSFFSQSRTYGYNIHEMSKVEDLVVVEDEVSQPRTLPNGNTVEYGHMYELLHAISHDKPVVAVTIVDGDYHTAPNFMRLAMAEAAAHDASYLSWPTWPESQRAQCAPLFGPKRITYALRRAIEFGTAPRGRRFLFSNLRNGSRFPTTDCSIALLCWKTKHPICRRVRRYRCRLSQGNPLPVWSPSVNATIRTSMHFARIMVWFFPRMTTKTGSRHAKSTDQCAVVQAPALRSSCCPRSTATNHCPLPQLKRSTHFIV